MAFSCITTVFENVHLKLCNWYALAWSRDVFFPFSIQLVHNLMWFWLTKDEQWWLANPNFFLKVKLKPIFFLWTLRISPRRTRIHAGYTISLSVQLTSFDNAVKWKFHDFGFFWDSHHLTYAFDHISYDCWWGCWENNLDTTRQEVVLFLV